MMRFAMLLLGLAFTAAVQAKLPPMSDEQKLKADEAKSKAADAAKRDSDLLAKAQDGVASKYLTRARQSSRSASAKK